MTYFQDAMLFVAVIPLPSRLSIVACHVDLCWPASALTGVRLIAEQSDTFDASGGCQESEKRVGDAPDAAPVHDKPRRVASSWSMTSNTLHGPEAGALAGGRCGALSSDTNSHVGLTPGPIHAGQPLDLSNINGQPHHAHCSAPVNATNCQDLDHPASMPALQKYINAAGVIPLDETQPLPPSADRLLQHSVPPSGFDFSHHVSADMLKSRHQVMPSMNQASVSASMSCPDTSRRMSMPASQPHQAALQLLQLQSRDRIHQFLPPSSTAGASVRPSQPPAPLAAAVWPSQPDTFSSASITAAHTYHHSAPEHLNTAPGPVQAPNNMEPHLHAYISRPAPGPGMPQPRDLPAFNSAAAASASEMHLARLSLSAPLDHVDSTGRHPGQLYPLVLPTSTAAVQQAAPPNKPPDWCVVTGLKVTPGHVQPPESSGVVSVTSMLLWPLGIRAALQAGHLCLTMDPTELECRGNTFLPGLMFCCPHANEATTMAPLKGPLRTVTSPARTHRPHPHPCR